MKQEDAVKVAVGREIGSEGERESVSLIEIHERFNFTPLPVWQEFHSP